jgi:hypothetical protein
MRLRNILILLVLFFGMIGSNVFIDGQDEDDYGKLVGWVVDPISGAPVNEVFEIEFYKCDTYNLEGCWLKEAKTDNRGHFSIKLSPYKYCLHFSPESTKSKYCIEPSHFKNELYYLPVVIEKGKITNFIKKATPGGSLKIYLKGMDGERITREQFPGGSKISITIGNHNFLIPPSATNISDDNLDDGEMIINRLFPDTYSITISFRGTGYETQTRDNVNIDEGKVTEIEFLLDIEDTTGIEGKIIDINGKVVKYAHVMMLAEFLVSGEFDTYTDRYGNYRITGLPEGKYSIGISVKEVLYVNSKEIIEIKKNELLYKDITLKWAVE